ncbi:PTS fructose transporter subunit IIC [Streptobacillus moniliformis]|uniref:PTS system, fructose subfamily, IIC subunit n=1 Tax=Streptobacillus moniliformis (strain ATCC 14647 / DSM 12112 / NCTC 10651 / 9901) TaxID=519441 RepID=D1AVN3_STRM9|nr:PTS fructose transporter subunit IIC [Streptobacillus moniliformis]ACZ01793.1 PTS system, fructose subfamily, IIC subunit [Streptobacillus moniliformis DSM 12112]AVL43213.1 PTS fructose transporter subunit IIC [Streptobacillus moniliformis]SQA13011.1 PTS system fructose-like EIIC component 1 [Streptobacillus moniliformis]SQA14428.1 PTS system fructose-like EIIC component 1 [Streptobacillus moniliformis]
MEIKKRSRKVSGIQSFYRHIMTGISYMIPILIMGGLIGAFSQVLPYVLFKIDPSVNILGAINSGEFSGFNLQILKFAHLMESFGFTLFGFAIPMFAAFVANSIGGKTALAAGFIGGYIANRPISIIKLLDSGVYDKVAPVPSGFFGAIIIGIFIGYIVKWLNQNIKLSEKWLAFKTTFLIPLLSALICMIAMIFVITPIGGWLNVQIRNLLEIAGKQGEYVYALISSAATAFDLGGPINKAASFVAIGFSADKILPLTARNIAVVIPSIGLGLSTLIDRKLVGRRVYNKEFYNAGKTSIFLAFMGISEGAIPFALENPVFVIPLYVISAVIGAMSAVMLGAVQWFPESAIWAWPLVTKLPSYILGIAIGSIIIAVVNVIYRNYKIKKGELEVDEE